MNRLSIALYNRYRAYQRSRRALPGTLPVRRRTTATVLRGKFTRAAAVTVAAVGIFAGGAAYEHHHEYAARQDALEQQWDQSVSHTQGLIDAYDAAYSSELKARHAQPPRSGGIIAHLDYLSEHQPRDPSTLAVRDQLKNSQGRDDQLTRELFPSD